MSEQAIRRTKDARPYIVYLYNQPQAVRVITRVDIIRMYKEALVLMPSSKNQPVFVIPDDESDEPTFVAMLGSIQAVVMGSPLPPTAETRK